MIKSTKVKAQALLSEEEKDVSSIMNSSGGDETLPKPGVPTNETFDLPAEENENDSDAQSDKAVIILKPRHLRKDRAKRSVPVYNPMRDSSEDLRDSDSSRENMIKSKAKKFCEKSNKSFEGRKGFQTF